MIRTNSWRASRMHCAGGPGTSPYDTSGDRMCAGGGGRRAGRPGLGVVRPAAPEARDGGVALRAGSPPGDAVIENAVTDPLDEERPARRAARVLELADRPRNVPRVDEPQAFLPADLRG